MDNWEDSEDALLEVYEQSHGIASLIRSDHIPLLTEVGDPALACITTDAFKIKLIQKEEEEEEKGRECQDLLKDIIQHHLARDGDREDINSGGYVLFSVGLCRAFLLRSLGGDGRKYAVDMGEGAWR